MTKGEKGQDSGWEGAERAPNMRGRAWGRPRYRPRKDTRKGEVQQGKRPLSPGPGGKGGPIENLR